MKYQITRSGNVEINVVLLEFIKNKKPAEIVLGLYDPRPTSHARRSTQSNAQSLGVRRKQRERLDSRFTRRCDMASSQTEVLKKLLNFMARQCPSQHQYELDINNQGSQISPLEQPTKKAREYLKI